MTSATVTPVAKVRQAVTMTVSPSWRQEHSAAAAENGSLRVSRSGDPSWLPISDEDEGSRCSRADFRKESGSVGCLGVSLAASYLALQSSGRGIPYGPPRPAHYTNPTALQCSVFLHSNTPNHPPLAGSQSPGGKRPQNGQLKGGIPASGK